MKNFNKLFNTILISSCILGLFNSNLNFNSYASSPGINLEISSNKLDASDFKKEDNLPEKTYDSENWADDLYTPDDLLGGQTNITMDEFENKILDKMLEVVSLMQTFTKPFCIILFILCGLGVLTSIVFNTNKQKMFILGLILSVITYVGVIFAPNIVLFFANWLSF